MPVLVLALLIAMTLQETVSEVGRTTYADSKTTKAHTLGTDLLVLRNALNVYWRANPGVDGLIPLAALGLPDWFKPTDQLYALIDGSNGYVYYTPQDFKPDLTALLGANVSAYAGVARNGQLQSPYFLPTIPLPEVIPDQSIVLIL